MKTSINVALGTAALVANVAAQGSGNHGGNNWSGSNNGNGYGYSGAPSCMSSCWPNANPTTMCGNATAIDSFNTCVSGSSCSDSDKTGAYQVIAQICANTGTTVSASPEATFSATSGGNAWPTTNSAWASYASAFATITGTPTGNPFVNATGAPGWVASNGYGPFGHGGPQSGWGPWASQSSGAWTSGPWTSWWGTNGCPPSTWSGWTSGPWGTSAPWTSWTACSATTTASSVMTTTVTTGGTTSIETTTALGIQVAQASNTGTASGSAASATSSGSAGERRAVAGVGAGLSGLVAAVLMM